MKIVKIHDVTVKVSGQTATIFDVFQDVSSQETNTIISYLVDEGFLNPNKEILVTVKSNPLFKSEKREFKKRA